MMRKYDLPDVERLTPVEAAEVIRGIQVDVQVDPEHPLMNKSHPQRAEFMAARDCLYEKAATASRPIPLTPDKRGELQAELAGIEAEPGFMTGRLKIEDREKHAGLVARQSELYKRLAEADEAQRLDEEEAVKPKPEPEHYRRK